MYKKNMLARAVLGLYNMIVQLWLLLYLHKKSPSFFAVIGASRQMEGGRAPSSFIPPLSSSSRETASLREGRGRDLPNYSSEGYLNSQINVICIPPLLFPPDFFKEKTMASLVFFIPSVKSRVNVGLGGEERKSIVGMCMRKRRGKDYLSLRSSKPVRIPPPRLGEERGRVGEACH